MSGVGFGVCRVCGETFDRRRRNAEGKIVGQSDTRTCPRHRWGRRDVSEVLVDRDTRYEKDVACQLFVATFRGGATLDSIAEAIGVSRERVRQIETEAIRKVRGFGLAAFGADPEEERIPRHDVPGGPDEEQDEEEPEPTDDDGALPDPDLW